MLRSRGVPSRLGILSRLGIRSRLDFADALKTAATNGLGVFARAVSFLAQNCFHKSRGARRVQQAAKRRKVQRTQNEQQIRRSVADMTAEENFPRFLHLILHELLEKRQVKRLHGVLDRGEMSQRIVHKVATQRFVRLHSLIHSLHTRLFDSVSTRQDFKPFHHHVER